MRTSIRAIVAPAVLGAALVATPVDAADVHVGIHIGVPPPVYRFDAPPALVVVPGVPGVRYAPNVGVSFFAYGDRYYTYHDDAWFIARDEYGPWSYVERRAVPAPVLSVPTRYYHAMPRHRGGHYGKSRYHHGGRSGWKHDDRHRRHDDRGHGGKHRHEHH